MRETRGNAGLFTRQPHSDRPKPWFRPGTKQSRNHQTPNPTLTNPTTTTPTRLDQAKQHPRRRTMSTPTARLRRSLRSRRAPSPRLAAVAAGDRHPAASPLASLAAGAVIAAPCGRGWRSPTLPSWLPVIGAGDHHPAASPLASLASGAITAAPGGRRWRSTPRGFAARFARVGRRPRGSRWSPLAITTARRGTPTRGSEVAIGRHRHHHAAVCAAPRSPSVVIATTTRPCARLRGRHRSSFGRWAGTHPRGVSRLSVTPVARIHAAR